MKGIKTSLFIIVASLIIFSSGCEKSIFGIDGNHNVVTETRTDMPHYNRIVNAGAFDVYVIQDSIWEITIEAESNLVPYIRTLVNGTTLTIDSKESLNANSPMKLYVHTPDIFALTLSGSGLVYADTVITTTLDLSLPGSGDIDVYAEANDVSAEISGSGTINFGMLANNLGTLISGSGEIYFWGEIDQSDMTISGSGSIRSYDLEQRECHATISGSGDMYVNVADYLQVTIPGSGSVYYMGNPDVETNITGSGQVIHQ